MASTFYIPVEVFKREFTSKLTLAVFLSLKGARVIIGHRWYVIGNAVKNSTKGDFFINMHTLTQEDKQQFKTLFDRGVNFIGVEEESVFDSLNYSDQIRIRKQELGFYNYKLWLCWGKRDYLHLVEKFGNTVNFANIGTPRSALWGKFGEKVFESQISKKIKPDNGDFILIATSFYIKETKKHSEAINKLNSKNSEYDIDSFSESISKNTDDDKFELLRELILKILSKTNLNILVRPYTIEDKIYAKKLKKLSKRIRIDNSLDATPLILSCKALLHMGSTVGIESRCAIKNTISLENFLNPKIKFPKLSSLLSHQPNDIDQVIECISRKKAHKKSVLKFVTNPGGIEFYQKFIEQVEKIDKNAFSGSLMTNDTNYLKRKMIYKLRTFLVRGKIYRYDLVKRPPIGKRRTRELLVSILNGFEAEHGSLKLRKIERDTYVLEQLT
jgi:surface carbohydrate biosynthesis protein